MSAQAAIREDLVMQALMGLHRAWPLERRIQREACDATQETYTALLTRWVQTADGPQPVGFDDEALDELAALDAVYLTADRLACPPFCPAQTDIVLHFPHGTLHAVSALDALALPRLLDAPARIETRCPISDEVLSFTVTRDGSLREEDLGAASLAMRKIAAEVRRYPLDLAPGIRFVHPAAGASMSQALTLLEGAAVAHAFYAFQRKLLAG